ncbi:YibE/F family protein [Alkaliphilus pronyensis]|uniref:YibE/F family protein n=1 Tax=Alkaliphilus pronyensis TaxID=1482732 RepID=A0A6I0F806_9FIRM|nr:YibE/F family protein [Alkaliphilus pronyensis]KAB3539081.1 YibE/F family protein [Alkaliphilus pronyensis]
MRKNFIIIMIITILFTGFSYSADTTQEEMITERGKVIAVDEVDTEESAEDFLESKLVTIEVLSGKYEGQQFTIKHYLSGSYGYDLPVKAGDRVLIVVEELEDSVEVYIADYIRDTYVFGVIALFIALLVIIGKKTGVKALVTLGITITLVMKFLLPGILRGYSPILLTVITSILITLITIFIIAGISIKSFSAIIGIMGGVITAGLITFIIGSQVKLTGLSGEEATMLMYIPQNIQFDFKGLLFSGIMLGALGAVMDVGISVASAMEEIKRLSPHVKVRELIMSGMNVGKDIMGTMTNTLILAYTGSAIPLLLLFMAYETDMIKIINLDIIATEIVRAVSGTIGLILTIPITAFTSGILYEKYGASSNKNTVD